MSIGQEVGLALLVIAFVFAKIIVLFSKPGGIAIAALGASLLIFSEPENAN